MRWARGPRTLTSCGVTLATRDAAGPARGSRRLTRAHQNIAAAVTATSSATRTAIPVHTL